MIRITTLLWVALLVIAGGTVMHVSYQVRHLDRRLDELATKTRQEQEAIRILGAEWDSLNDPKRIDGLAKRYLSLAPTPIQRVVQLENVPIKPSPEQIARLDAAAAAKASKDRQPTRKPEAEVKPGARPIEVAARPAPAVSAAGPAAAPMVGAAPRAGIGVTGIGVTGIGMTGIGMILARAERPE